MITDNIIVTPQQAQSNTLPFQRAEIEGTIQARFVRVAAACADQPALVGTVPYTYAELNRAANQLAQRILTLFGPASATVDEPVALLLGHDTPHIMAMLGVLKAGRIYASLAPSAPVARLHTLLENLETRLIITNTEYASLASELIGTGGYVLNLDEMSPADEVSEPPCQTQPTAPATIAYTSGSTGTPKGVVKTHRALLHSAWNKSTTDALSRQDRVALLYLATISAVWDPLLNGNTLVLYDVQRQGGANLGQWLVDQQITNLRIPIELYRQLLDSLPRDAYFPHLRSVGLGGRFYRHDVTRSWPYLPPGAKISSRFSATETGRVTLFQLDETTHLPTNLVPTGYPISDVEIFLRNEAGQPAAVDEAGQIYVRGQYLPSGYWRDPVLTQQVYQPDPERPGWRICCTGDWGRLRADGMLEFIGRKDARVKIRGHRIDLGEVEAALLNVAGIRSTVVTVQDRTQEEKYLVAYYVATTDAGPTVSAMRAELAQTLPEYMIPTLFLRIETLPLLPNGKVDRKALPVPDPSLHSVRPALATAYRAPRTPLEETVVAIWEDVLGIQPVGIDDNFMALGGNSLRAMQIHVRLLRQFQIELATSQLFACATIDAMAQLIAQQVEATEESLIAELLNAVEALSQQEAGHLLAKQTEKQ